MAEIGNDYEFSGKPKSSISNRSLKMQSAPTDALKKPYPTPFVERASSIKKIYGSPFKMMVTAGILIKGKVNKLRSLFESSKLAKHVPVELPSPTKPKLLKSDSWVPRSLKNTSSLFRLPGTEDRIVVYFTSLHGIRRTFEDCYAAGIIFRGFWVCVDEHDISMDSAYRKELQSVLGEKNVSLPQVFIRGKYVGGAEVIKQLHETGKTARILHGLPVMKPGYVCDGYGGMRFVPCTNCDGSRKVFDEDEDALKRCLECNENGLIRCPNCCS